ncbi:hypothetical protein APHAL10511_004063 [Amanita phalloides]|nr:hypothetical protein APHAL10511_004063 [Amanita phalloides]
MIQIIFALLFSLLFGTSVATESGRPDSPTREVPKPTLKVDIGEIRWAFPGEWGQARKESSKPRPVVVLGPDVFTQGWGTLVVEISHNPLKKDWTRPLTDFFPKGTRIPPVKDSSDHHATGKEITKESRINVKKARVVLTVENVLIACESVLKMEEKYVAVIKQSISEANLAQTRHPSLYYKDIRLKGLGHANYYQLDDKYTFVPSEYILEREREGKYDFNKHGYWRSTYPKAPCTQPQGGEGKKGKEPSSCAGSPGKKNTELAVIPGTPQPGAKKPSWAAVASLNKGGNERQTSKGKEVIP